MNRHLVSRFGDFEADPEAWRLSRDGAEIHLDPVVLKLLFYLIENCGRLVTRQELMDTVWGDTVISESALTKAAARLRKALGDDSANHRYLETVRSQGYRFVAPVEEAEHLDGADSPSRKARGPTLRRGLLVGAALVAMIMVVGYWFLAPLREPPEEKIIRSLAVLPLDNLTGDPEQDNFVDGLQDLLTTQLSQLPGLRVTSRQSTIRYRGSELPATEIAEQLGVDALVEGSLLRKNGTIELTIQLVCGCKDEHLWAERYARDTSRVFDLVSDVANAVGVEIGASAASPEGERPGAAYMNPVDPRVIDAYALGIKQLDRLSRDGIRSAIEALETAVAIEPQFGLAWGQLSLAYTMQGMFGFIPPRESKEKLRACSLRAIEANPKLSIGHSGFGWANFYTGRFDRACALFAEALRLNPSAPYALHGEADCLLFDGRMDESIARLRELQKIGPFNTIDSLPLPSHLYMAHRFEESIDEARALQARIPQYSMHFFLALLYWEQGRFDEAIEEERLEFEHRGDSALLAALEAGLDADGPQGALRFKAEALVARSNESYVDPNDIGETFARAGLIDEAIRWLDKAVENGSYKITYIAFWPHFDLLRDDPRFRGLEERVYGEKVQDIRRLRISTPR
ncbi:MAG: winged helix-turn-helix domain-containing protein [Woeseiaceae bacterium]